MYCWTSISKWYTLVLIIAVYPSPHPPYTVVYLDMQIVLGLFVLLLHFWAKRKVLKFMKHCLPLVVGKPKRNKTKQLEKLKTQGKAMHKNMYQKFEYSIRSHNMTCNLAFTTCMYSLYIL